MERPTCPQSPWKSLSIGMREGNWDIAAVLNFLGFRVDTLLSYLGGVFHCCSGCRTRCVKVVGME